MEQPLFFLGLKAPDMQTFSKRLFLQALIKIFFSAKTVLSLRDILVSAAKLKHAFLFFFIPVISLRLFETPGLSGSHGIWTRGGGQIPGSASPHGSPVSSGNYPSSWVRLSFLICEMGIAQMPISRNQKDDEISWM